MSRLAYDQQFSSQCFFTCSFYSRNIQGASHSWRPCFDSCAYNKGFYANEHFFPNALEPHRWTGPNQMQASFSFRNKGVNNKSNKRKRGKKRSRVLPSPQGNLQPHIEENTLHDIFHKKMFQHKLESSFSLSACFPEMRETR